MQKEKIYIFDTTLRDGEQVPGCQLNTEEKVEIALELEQLGIDVIEAGFPVSSPGDYKSVREVSKAVKNVVVCGLSRVVEKDIDVAAECLTPAFRKRIHTGIATSDIHIKHKLNSSREEVLERAVRGVRYARNLVDEVEFYAEDAGRTDNTYLAQVVSAVIKAGAGIVNIPDTTGYCLPNEYGDKIKYLIDNVEGIENVVISTHCHNDLGLATANSISAVMKGATQVEGTINGIGERAGNTALEEVIMIIKSHSDLNFYTNINIRNISRVSRLISQKMKMLVQKNKAIVGANAFAHSSGIHQDGVIKYRQNYEVIDPEEIGAQQSSINLTARSGRAALNYCLLKIGYSLSKEELNYIYPKFIELADKTRYVDNASLQSLMESVKHKMSSAK